jgi:hypothetical protein
MPSMATSCRAVADIRNHLIYQAVSLQPSCATSVLQTHHPPLGGWLQHLQLRRKRGNVKSQARENNQSRSDSRRPSADGVASVASPAQVNSKPVQSRADKRPDPAVIGKKVLAGLAKGRARLAIVNQQRKDQSAQWAVSIYYLALADQEAGRPTRGRAGRISRKLQGRLGERLVRKYMARLITCGRFGGVRS